MTTAFERKIDEMLDNARRCPYCGEEIIDFNEYESISPHGEGCIDIVIECTSCPAAMIEREIYSEDASNDVRLEAIGRLFDYWNTAEHDPNMYVKGKDYDSETEAYADYDNSTLDAAYSDISQVESLLYRKRVIDTRFADEDNPVVRVLFTKQNGEEREMYCTTDKSMIPEEALPSEGSKKKTYNPDVKTVFDLEKKAWRCFRYDSVIEFE